MLHLCHGSKMIIRGSTISKIAPIATHRLFSTRTDNARYGASVGSNDEKKSIPSFRDGDIRTVDTFVKYPGLNKFMTKVHLTSGLTFTSMIGSSYLLAGIEPITALCVGLIGGLGSVVAFSSTNPTFKTIEHVSEDNKRGTMITVSENSPMRKLLYGTTFASMSMMLSPMITMVDPSIVATAAAATGSIMLGSGAYAYMAKPDSLLKYQGVAYGALLGLVGVGLTSVAIGMLSGGSDLFYLLRSIDTYAGLAVFTGLNAVDTHTAIKLFKEKQPDHLACSMNSALNAANIFVRMMEILSKFRR